MLRIFMTGDNHIGLKYASHENREHLISARIDAFGGMIAAANEQRCDLFVVTGDLFENNNASKKDVMAVVDILRCFNGTVAVLPGNHDFYDMQAKTWQYMRAAVEACDNIMLLSDFKPYKIELSCGTAVLYPALCKSLHSEPGKNNLDWIKSADIPSDSVYRIGIAHGAVEGETIDSEGRYFLMKRSELEKIPLDAWLIGHTHVPFPNNLTTEFAVTERIFNAGTHVQTDVNCGTEGLCFIIEIDPDKTVRAKKFVSGGLRFYRKNIELRAGEMDAVLSRELDSIGEDSVVDCIISGTVTVDEYDRRHTAIQAKLSRFIEGTYSDSALSKLISKELIDAEFAETSVSAMLLNSLLDNPKEAQLAYELLNSLKEGK